MRKLEETPEGYLAEAIRLEEQARVCGQAGDFTMARISQRDAEFFLNEAAKMEKTR